MGKYQDELNITQLHLTIFAIYLITFRWNIPQNTFQNVYDLNP